MLRLESIPGFYAVCKLSADSPPPDWAVQSPFLCITRTADEVSVVCSVDAVPPGALSEVGFRLFRVAGRLPFDAIGIISGLAGPLAAAEVPVFCISTFETDYLLVRDTDFDRTVSTLRNSGFDVADTNKLSGS